MTKTQRLQQRVVKDYAASLGLPTPAHYWGGAPLQPLPPLDTTIGGFMIVGAYPSARFQTVGKLRDVPVGDNLGPFEPERYFDGDAVRTLRSADELHALYLGPLGLDRGSCWITDLLKVFLFKPGHRAKYQQLGIEAPIGYDRERFEELATASIAWLAEEMRIAQPKLVITLGREVAGILRSVRSATARNQLLGGTPQRAEIAGVSTLVVHLAHPGILMRGAGKGHNPWPDLHRDQHIPALRAAMDAFA